MGMGTMRIDVLTLFPEMFESPLSHSILKRAQDAGVVEIVLTNIRDFSKDKHKKVDDRPYGGGPGMVMMCQPVFDCFEQVEKLSPEKGRVILLTPTGQTLHAEISDGTCRRKTAHPHSRALRGVRRTNQDGLERRANLNRRLCAFGRGTGGDGNYRRGGAAAARCAGR